MDINQNNAQINTFVGGMNSDTSLDQVQSNQYLFGLNIRISNNSLIFEEPNSNTKEGIVSPVKSGKLINIIGTFENVFYKRILAVDSIKDVGVIILLDNEDHWCVFRVQYIDESSLKVDKILTSEKTVEDAKRFSIVLNEELKDVIKLYIANGTDEIMQLFVKYDRIDEQDYTQIIDQGEITNNFVLNGKKLYKKEDLLKSNYIFPVDKVKIADKISGHLKTSQVQYTYRFYKKYGISSRLSPLTNKIQVINDSKHSENGCAEDTETNIGFLLNIPCNEGFAQLFDRLQIYRLDYIKPNQNAEVNLIYDGELIYKDNKISISDTGLETLQALTIEEFASLNGQDVIPLTIESSQGYMFASNIEDKSSIWLDINDYNPRAYQFTKPQGAQNLPRCILYSDDDITYTETNIYNSAQYPTGNNVEIYTHNKTSDVNYSGLLTDGCFMRRDGVLGGEGPNISWRFVTTQIDVHQDVQHIKKPDVTYNSNNLKNPIFYYCKYENNRIVQYKIQDYTGINYLDEKCVYDSNSFDYNNIIGSSLLRSLQRNEVYRYGIVFYDERGVRTDVLWIADIRTPSIKELYNFVYNSEVASSPYILTSIPIGIQFDVNMPEHPDKEHTFVGYEIVRCEKNYTTVHNILQGALASPIRQLLPEENNITAYSPYYPSGLITTSTLYMSPVSSSVVSSDGLPWDTIRCMCATNKENHTLFQLFNPQILYQRDDTLQLLQNIDLGINILTKRYVKTSIDQFGYDLMWGNFMEDVSHDTSNPQMMYRSGQYWWSLLEVNGFVLFNGNQRKESEAPYKMQYKINKTTIYNAYEVETTSDIESAVVDIQDVKNPTWEEGFSNITFTNDAAVATAVSAYKSFITSIQNETYINWACSDMYDITTGREDTHGIYDDIGYFRMYIDVKDRNSSDDGSITHSRDLYSCGNIGPGPVCFILKTKDNLEGLADDTDKIITSICNLTHNAVQFAGLTEQEKQYDLYYGFGNFVKFEGSKATNTVFDGDIYNLPCEFVSLFKTYDFNCLIDALPSTQIVYYIPMESKINTFFDYGMNYKNTTNPNLQLEPGRIDGVSSQTRPLHQMNLIYSDNINSNNMFNPQTSQKNIEIFQQRILYSQLKTNGENIDNWQIFKAIDFIDVDSRYGQVTSLLAVNDVLYFWQEQGFGKLSVNERSLVTDTNSNLVQLGQAGVLQRSDYLDTKHGLRKYDYSVINVGTTIFWIDILNKCIATFTNGGVVNYSEYKNVQNVVNNYCIDDNMFSDDVTDEHITHLPTIHFDLQNDELLCDCLYGNVSLVNRSDDDYRMQLIFNTKLNIATSVYNRNYDDILNLNGRIYGIKLDVPVTITKYNHLDYNDTDLLIPTVLHFVVNQSATDTKVFDNQKIVTLKKKYTAEEQSEFFKQKAIMFETDLNRSYKYKLDKDLIQNSYDFYQITNRESNLQYAIPRETGSTNDPIDTYGKRLRGKWMQVYMYDSAPKIDYSISHIITKFRKSFS